MNWTPRHTALLFSAVLMTLPACRTRQGVPNAMTDQANAFSLAGQSHITSIVVKEDDTVYSIAYNHGVTTKSLILLNDIPKPYTLKVGQKLDLPKPGEHIVDEGETNESIALIYGVSPMILARENELDLGSTLTPRQRLTIPPKDLNPAVLSEEKIEEVSIAAAPLAPVASVPSKMGENKTTSAALPDELAAELAREKSGTKKETHSAVAPSLATATIPATAAGAAVAAIPSAPLPAKKPIALHKTQHKAQEKATPAPQPEVAAAPVIPPVKQAPTFEVAKPSPAPAVASAEFIRPVDGKMIAKFGDKVATGKNDGINLLAPLGTPVKAAADGTVVYAGNELKGFGNLVLIKHEGGWITAYGHNSSITVAKGQAVKQGDIIAKVGKTGDVNEPQLHFEIRKGTQTIDPLGKLGS